MTPPSEQRTDEEIARNIIDILGLNIGAEDSVIAGMVGVIKQAPLHQNSQDQHVGIPLGESCGE